MFEVRSEKRRIRTLPPPFAVGTRPERGCPPAAAAPVTQGCPMFRDATSCERTAAGDSRAPGAVSRCDRLRRWSRLSLHPLLPEALLPATIPSCDRTVAEQPHQDRA